MTASTTRPRSYLREGYTQIRTSFEFGDALFFFYLLVVLRQYLWITSHNSIAWTLSVLLAAVCWYLYVSTKQFKAEKFDRSFWLVVALPLLAAYLLRAAMPEHSDDVWSYHLLHAERSLRGPLYGAGDFFPTALPFNPVSDTLTGLSRFFLGFRLGTVINLLVLLWSAQIVDRILRPFIVRAWPRSACVLLIVLSEQFLFEISTYMVDLLTLPLCLQAMLLILRDNEARNRRANLAHVALLIGMSTAFKITNLAIGLPILAICAYQMTAGTRRLAPTQLVTTTLLMLTIFLAPLVPFSIFIYRLTGNPIFPLANAIFNSPYWTTNGGWDYRWGPQTIWETVVWPVLVWFKPERSSELALYSGRISFGFVVALPSLLIMWRNARLRVLCFVFVSSAMLWSVANLGYSRYGLCQEMLAGITVVATASALLAEQRWKKISWRIALASTLFVILAIQAFFAIAYSLRKEWGGRPTIVQHPGAYAREARFMFRDHSLRSFLTVEEMAVIDNVQVWIEAAPKSTGFEVLLNPQAPVIAVRQAEYFFTRDSWHQFVRVVEASQGRRMFAICLQNDLAATRGAITQRGLEVGKTIPMDLPFFSPRDRIGIILVEVLIPQDAEARARFESAWMQAAFAASVYREQIVAINPPSMMRPGEKAEIRFRVKNLGSAAWPAVGTKDFRQQVDLGNHWISAGGATEDSRAVMNSDLQPGSEVELTLGVNAPRTPGEYTLEIDMVHEGVTWFKERGGRALQLHVRVQP
jgi:Ig-like domain from next to BRCA1 gene